MYFSWVRKARKPWNCEQLSFHSRNVRLGDIISFYQERAALELSRSIDTVFILKKYKVEFWKYELEVLINFKKKEILTLTQSKI